MPTANPNPVRIAHIGFGAFHRAHQALYTQLAANAGEPGWGICEISLFSEAGIAQLAAQDFRYRVLEIDDQRKQLIEVRAAREGLNPQRDGRGAIVERLAHADIAIVSLTITEKGYCLRAGEERLDTDNPLIRRDLEQPQQPHSAIGFIVAALALRRARGLPPFSVLSCDNLPGNGRMARAAVVQLAQRQDPQLAHWIDTEVRFPATMVDRIVPAMNGESHQLLARELGHIDPCGIVCEPFKQWVIEDNFVGGRAGRPAWEKAGAQLVAEVAPFETMKLRLLNGAHSFIAYLGYLAGCETVAEAVAERPFYTAARRLMLQEQAPTLVSPEGAGELDPAGYAEQLLRRFANSHLRHRTWQIAMDGSQKIPQRWLNGIAWHLQRGTPWPLLALGVAGWLRYIQGTDDSGNAIDVRDPLSAQFCEIDARAGGGAAGARALLTALECIPEELRGNALFVEPVLAAYRGIHTHGARQALIHTLAEN